MIVFFVIIVIIIIVIINIILCCWPREQTGTAECRTFIVSNDCHYILSSSSFVMGPARRRKQLPLARSESDPKQLPVAPRNRRTAFLRRASPSFAACLAFLRDAHCFPSPRNAARDPGLLPGMRKPESPAGPAARAICNIMYNARRFFKSPAGPERPGRVWPPPGSAASARAWSAARRGMSALLALLSGAAARHQNQPFPPEV